MDIEKAFARRFLYTRFNAPLKELTTFKIGGKAKLVVDVTSDEDVADAVELAKTAQIPYFVLGNGSNVLADDEGYSGVIIRFSRHFSKIETDGRCITADAGALGKRVSDAALENSLSGAEFLSTFPASIGGATVSNAGCFGHEMKDIVDAVWTLEDKEIKMYTGEECGFGYRKSIFREKKLIILRVRLKLERGSRADIAKVRAELLEKRKAAQPGDYPSAGSIFKRPPGSYAGLLVDRAGLKGFQIGGARISSKHAGFIVNTGNAASSEVKALIEISKNKVKDLFLVELEEEIVRLGDTDDNCRLPHPH